MRFLEIPGELAAPPEWGIYVRRAFAEGVEEVASHLPVGTAPPSAAKITTSKPKCTHRMSIYGFSQGS